MKTNLSGSFIMKTSNQPANTRSYITEYAVLFKEEVARFKGQE